jgi:hypothetical protein
MRHWLVATALAAGCSFSHGVSAGDDNQPKDGSISDMPVVIDMVMTDTPTDTPPDMPPAPTDSDGDGVVDTSDNCPTMANANQRDHDADGHGDVCDKCPHLASATDPDGDGDGVGDACDPRPMMAGDQRVLFEGFYDATSIMGWSEGGNGNWSVANGVLTQSSNNASTTTNTLGPPGSIARAAVTAGVHVISLGNNQSNFDTPHVSVSAGVGSNQSYWCSVVDEGNSDKVYATTINGLSQNFPNTAWPGMFVNGSDLRLNLALLGGNNVCTAVQGATTAMIQGNTNNVGGTVQVATRTASASFDYLFVVSIGN